jgi:hypothetical protein
VNDFSAFTGSNLTNIDKQIIMRTEANIAKGAPINNLTSVAFVEDDVFKDDLEMEFRKYHVYEIFDLFKITFNEYMQLPISEADFCLRIGKKQLEERLKQEELQAKKAEKKAKFNNF